MLEPTMEDLAIARQSDHAARPLEATAHRRIAGLLANPDLHHPAFQPILSLVDGAVVGYEAFSRFATEPVRPPDRWFAEATRVGLGWELQAMTIERILAAAAGAGMPGNAFLSLNVSPRHLAHPAVAEALARADPSLLVVEITEEEEVGDYAALRRAMALHLERGVRFAVDDAGAGFASMRHVTELGPAYVKLDASLVRGMRGRRTLQAFLRALNGFTSEIGAALVAEGVEKVSDLAILTRTGFPLLAQGYAIARPGAPWPRVSAAASQAWLEASRDRVAIPLPTRASRSVAGGPSPRSIGSPVHNGVNIGVVLAASLRDAHIETLETLRALGAVAAWRKLRAVEPELATHRTLLALEGAIRGVRWGTLPNVDRQKLISAIAAEGNGAGRTTG